MGAGSARAALALDGARAPARCDPLREADDRVEARVVTEQQRADEQQQRNQRQRDLKHCSENLSESRPTAQRITLRRMRPERDNIAAPDLPASLVWLGEE